MENREKISVLMAIYNTEFFMVKRAIDSVLNQTFQNFELILIDDGSSNDTQNLIMNYAKIHENKIVYIRHKNRGQSQSINRGILNSVGSYIAILDADDAYKPQHLEACLREMRFSDLIASTTETVVDSEEDYFVLDKYDVRRLIHVDDCVLFATLFGKKEVFQTLKFQDEYGADADFFQRAAQKFCVNKLDLRTYIYYRNMPNSICSVVKKQQFESSNLN
jgi:glycosyltransferase involved in cell wall biosynthesis